MERRLRISAATAAALAITLGLAACGDDGNSSDSIPALTIGTAPATTSPGTMPTGSSDTMSTDTMPTETMSSGVMDTTTGTDVWIDNRLSKAGEALRKGDFSTMLRLLSLSGLADELENKEYTILAPTEEAFSSLSGSQLSDIITNPTQIDDILRRHILDGVYSYEDLTGMTEVTTIGGDTLEVSYEGGTLTIDGAEVSEPTDQMASGQSGQEFAVFGIDTVLLGE